MGCEDRLIVVPLIPVLSDPEAFHIILSARTRTTTVAVDQPQQNPRTPSTPSPDLSNITNPLNITNPFSQPHPHDPEYTESYKTISFHGERQLRHLCETLTYHLFGHGNREICTRVCNNFWRMIIGFSCVLFTAFIPWVPQPPSQSTRGQPTRTEGHGQRTQGPQTYGHWQRTRTRTPTSGPSTQQQTSPEANNAATSS